MWLWARHVKPGIVAVSLKWYYFTVNQHVSTVCSFSTPYWGVACQTLMIFFREMSSSPYICRPSATVIHSHRSQIEYCIFNQHPMVTTFFFTVFLLLFLLCLTFLSNFPTVLESVLFFFLATCELFLLGLITFFTCTSPLLRCGLSAAQACWDKACCVPLHWSIWMQCSRTCGPWPINLFTPSLFHDPILVLRIFPQGGYFTSCLILFRTWFINMAHPKQQCPNCLKKKKLTYLQKCEQKQNNLKNATIK